MNPDQEAREILRTLDEISFPTIGLIIVVALAAAWVIERVVPWIAAQLPPRFRFNVLPIAPILRLLVLGYAVVRVISLVIQPTAQNVLAIAGALAVALGFAFKDYVSSIIAGIVALIERPYRPGDWVRIGSSYGEVERVGLRAINIHTPDDNKVTIPHSALWSQHIVNVNDGRRDHLCAAEFYLDPRHDAVVVERALRDVALTSPYLKLDRPIQVVVEEQPWATHYSLRAYPIEGRTQLHFITDLTLRGKDTLAALQVPPARAVATALPGPTLVQLTAPPLPSANSSFIRDS